MNSLKFYLLIAISLIHFDMQANAPVYQIMVTSIRNVSETSDKVSITCNLLNLSGKTLIFNDEIAPDQVNFKFEESFSRNKLFCYKKEIISKLLHSNIEIRRGKMVKSIPIELNRRHEMTNVNIKKSKKSKRNRKNRKKKNENLNTNDTQLVSDESVDKKSRNPFRKKKKKEEYAFSANESIQDSKASHHLKDVCVDIVIDTIIIVKRTKNYITIEYTLSNQGKATANLYGDPYDDNDNMALKIFLGRSENITRGSIPFGGGFIEKGLKNGLLKVGKTYTGKMKLSTKDLTRFTPYLIMKVDPFNVLNECHRRNNNKAIKVDID